MGQVLQGGAGQAPARQAAIGAGLPVALPADTVNKVCASSLRAVEIADQMIRAGDHERDRRGRNGIDVERALCAGEGALRLPARQRGADRPHGPRRPDLELRRQAHGRAGLVCLARARHQPRGAGRVGVPLAASVPCKAMEEGLFSDETVPVGEVAARRRASPGHDAREARGAQARLRPGGNHHGRERAERERRRRRPRRHQRGVREEAWARRAGDHRCAWLRGRRVRLSGAHAGRGGQPWRFRRPARRSAT